MTTTVLRVVGAMATSFLGIGLVAGGMAALGLMEQLSDNYGTRMLGNAALGIIVTGLLLLYASTVGEVALHAFAFTWNRRDTLFAAATAVVTLGLSCGYMLLLDTTGAHSVTWIAPS
ncbi:MAG: hypothetical protein ICV68_16385 [Pyrinomonadaceae bacterium]|nr:hypothetical protein [Pyrinomonadaceae bacterium]